MSTRTHIVAVIALVGALAIPAPSRAGPLVGDPTACTGSWDGPGQTTCERLGSPGTVGQPPFALDTLDWTAVTWLWSVTARPHGVLSWSAVDGLQYQNGFDVFALTTAPRQFAFWPEAEAIVIGVEDLTGPSDWDYNDWAVRVPRAQPVPEGLGLPWAAIATGLLLYWRRRA